MQNFPSVTESGYDGEETLGVANTKLARHRTHEARYNIGSQNTHTDVQGEKIEEERTLTWQERL